MPGEVSASKGKRTPRSAVLDSRPEYERLGVWLRARREEVGIQQKPLSRSVGKPEQFLNKVEHGRQRIDLVEFLDVFQAMGIDPELTVGQLVEIASGETRPLDR